MTGSAGHWTDAVTGPIGLYPIGSAELPTLRATNAFSRPPLSLTLYAVLEDNMWVIGYDILSIPSHLVFDTLITWLMWQ